MASVVNDVVKSRKFLKILSGNLIRRLGVNRAFGTLLIIRADRYFPDAIGPECTDVINHGTKTFVIHQKGHFHRPMSIPERAEESARSAQPVQPRIRNVDRMRLS